MRAKVLNPEKVTLKGDKVVLKGEEHLSEEDKQRMKRNEYQRRYMARRRAQERAKKGELATSRGTVPVAPERLSKQEIRKISTEQLVELTEDTRNYTMEVIQAKLLDTMQDPEQFKKVNLATLATVFGILYDKTQLMRGLSTENISVRASLDVNMKADDALTELNRMREKYNETNSK